MFSEIQGFLLSCRAYAMFFRAWAPEVSQTLLIRVWLILGGRLRVTIVTLE